MPLVTNGDLFPTEEELRLAREYHDTVKKFTLYAKAQGSENHKRYYTAFERLINEHVGILSGMRNHISSDKRKRIYEAEGRIMTILINEMEAGKPYKDVYKTVKRAVPSDELMVG